MRRFSAEYLSTARDGLWASNPEALHPLDLSAHRRIVDVGAGSGEFTAVLGERAAPKATVIGVDADRTLLEAAGGDRIVGDATQLPLRSTSAGLVCCQALLVNLPTPVDAVREFHRVARTLGAAVEPNNAEVTVRSTVDREAALAERLREAFIAGTATDITLGDATALFEEAGFEDIRSHRVAYTRVIAPPYDEDALEAARRKVRATRLKDHRTTLQAGGIVDEEYDGLLSDWRAMGRTVVKQMEAGAYRRVEVVPYYVTVGRT